MENRLKALQELLRERKLDAAVVGHRPDWFYVSGFTGESGALVVSGKGMALVTDSRFTVQARGEMEKGRVMLQKKNLFSSLGDYVRENRFRKVGFDPGQMTVAQLRIARKSAGGRCRWVACSGLVQGLRSRKDAGELAQMRRTALLASDVVESAIRLLKPGVREFEIAAEIEYGMRRRGASGPAFETIVAFGERSALPHARPTSKRLRKNELVVLDLGVILAHYCSDMTRTVFVGRAPARVKTWYRGVREAQEAGVAAAKPGATCGEVDAAARHVLAGYKLDRYFTHSTGHGLGLEVHEDPRLARGQKARLESGFVVTIEPGVYLAGVGGIRIEDDIAVKPGMSEVLTRIPRDLIEL